MENEKGNQTNLSRAAYNYDRFDTMTLFGSDCQYLNFLSAGGTGCAGQVSAEKHMLRPRSCAHGAGTHLNVLHVVSRAELMESMPNINKQKYNNSLLLQVDYIPSGTIRGTSNSSALGSYIHTTW